MSRVESKFLLNLGQYEYLKHRFEFLFPRDSFTTQGKYPVFSQYLDTQELRFFYDKIDGEFDHTKIRIRKYSRNLRSKGPVFLEAKLKEGSDQRKIRLMHEDASFEHFQVINWKHLPPEEMKYFLEVSAWGPLTPTVNVFYDREPFEITFEDTLRLRLNFDTNILALFPGETQVQDAHFHERSLLAPQTVLLEIKMSYDEFPRFLQDEMRAIGAERTEFSKYCSSLLYLESLLDRP